MGKYSNGIETRNRILEICRELFYEKGYEKTTFKEISQLLGINQSAIHYHFKSKENILIKIYKETIKTNNDIVEFYSDKSTGRLGKQFFDLEIYLYKIWNDPKYRQFYIDARSRIGFGGDDRELMSRFYSDSSEEDISIADIDSRGVDIFNRLALDGFDHSMLHFINKYIEDLEFRKILKTYMWMYKKILDIPDDDYNKARTDLGIMEERCKWESLDTTLRYSGDE